ncbi:hypothetical protein A2U01_0107804, partial [Trifolium medium]|nr:hypothetical protein [Trifolium medium]
MQSALRTTSSRSAQVSCPSSFPASVVSLPHVHLLFFSVPAVHHRTTCFPDGSGGGGFIFG